MYKSYTITKMAYEVVIVIGGTVTGVTGASGVRSRFMSVKAVASSSEGALLSLFEPRRNTRRKPRPINLKPLTKGRKMNAKALTTALNTAKRGPTYNPVV